MLYNSVLTLAIDRVPWSACESRAASSSTVSYVIALLNRCKTAGQFKLKLMLPLRVRTRKFFENLERKKITTYVEVNSQSKQEISTLWNTKSRHIYFLDSALHVLFLLLTTLHHSRSHSAVHRYPNLFRTYSVFVPS